MGLGAVRPGEGGALGPFLREPGLPGECVPGSRGQCWAVRGKGWWSPLSPLLGPSYSTGLAFEG